jgi:hypothetical protein
MIVMLNLVYFSITTMSTTGFGDVLATKWYTELFNAAQIFCKLALSSPYITPPHHAI